MQKNDYDNCALNFKIFKYRKNEKKEVKSKRNELFKII